MKQGNKLFCKRENEKSWKTGTSNRTVRETVVVKHGGNVIGLANVQHVHRRREEEVKKK